MDADFTDSLRGMSKRRGIQKKTKKYANKLRHRVLTRGYTEVECFNLINAVKRHECVWNLSSEHYKNRTHCQMAWDEIEMEVGIPKEDITVKWTLLRQQFRVAFTKLKMSQSEPYAMSRHREPNTFYNSMLFLIPAMNGITESRDSNTLPTPSASTSLGSSSPSPNFNGPETIYGSAPFDEDDDCMSQSTPAMQTKTEPKELTFMEPDESERTVLFHRLGNWLDKNEHSSPPTQLPDKYEALANFMSTLLRNHSNREEADQVAAEMCKLATTLLSGNNGRRHK